MADVDEIYNYVQVDADIASSGQPSEVELAAISRAGYAVVINLALHDDPRYSLPDEAGTVRSFGMAYEHIPVIFTSPKREDLMAFFAAMALHQGKRIWVHCAANKRVSVFVGLYLRFVAGWTEADAFAVERRIWEPNPVWAEFKRTMLATLPPPRAR